MDWATRTRLLLHRDCKQVGVDETTVRAIFAEYVKELQKNFRRETPTILGLDEIYRGYDCTVSLDDARDSGSCKAGILSWCEQVGIDPCREALPLSEALEAFSHKPLTEVRLAVKHAVRRHRRAVRQTNPRAA